MARPLPSWRLEDAEQFCLHRGIALANLIEEDRPAVGPFEGPNSGLVCSSESPSIVSEKLRLQQLSGHRGAVDGLEGPITAVAGLVNRLCEQFLAGAALAQNQDGHVSQGSPLGTTDGEADGMAVANNVLEPIHLTWASGGQMLEIEIRFTEQLGHKIVHKVIGDHGALQFPPERLEEG